MPVPSFKLGQASVRLTLLLTDSTTGDPLTTLDNTSAGLSISLAADNESSETTYTSAGSTVETIAARGTFVAPTSGKVRFKHFAGGLYDVYAADARWAVSSARYVTVRVNATGAKQATACVPLTQVDPYSATAFITGVNSLAPPTNWNLDSIDGSGRRDVGKFNGDTGGPANLNTLTQNYADNGGYLNSNLAVILGTAISESGSGRMAAAFKKFFDVLSPITTLLTVANTTNITAGTVTAGTVSDKTGYALTSAYDPAKTASQAGDAMALTSGERTTLTAAIWNALTSGLTTAGSIGKRLVDFVTTLVYAAPDNAGISAAGSSAASAASSSASASTSAASAATSSASAATSSASAATSAAAAATSAGSADTKLSTPRLQVIDDLDAMITAQKFTEPALENAPASTGGGGGTITPLFAQTNNPRNATRDLPPIAQGSTPTDRWTITDAAGSAVSLSGKTVRFVAIEITDAGADADSVYDDTLTGLYKYETGGSGIVVSGTGHNVVDVTHSAANTATAGKFLYELWNASDKLLLVKGKLPIAPSVFDV